MKKTTKSCFLVFLLVAVMVVSGCSVLRKSGCGCPPVPTTGKMKH